MYKPTFVILRTLYCIQTANQTPFSYTRKINIALVKHMVGTSTEINIYKIVNTAITWKQKSIFVHTS